jgi:hypothetical protein
LRDHAALNWRYVLPGFVVTGPVPAVQRIEDTDIRTPGGGEDLFHVTDAIVGFDDTLQSIPNLAARGNEIVVRIDHDQPGDVLAEGHSGHLSIQAFAPASSSGRRD